jgi:nitroreductase/NAD-dependent dihydropyrimidine dehydrogenase PreA subunit
MEPAFDSSLCLRDGLCVRVCPIGRLDRGDDGGPRVLAGERCISCGHCVAVCPAGAVSRDGEPASPMPDGWRLEPEKVALLLKSRRSIRAFRSDPLAREIIEAMIDVARYAPSGHNSQPLAWSVVSGPANIGKIAEATLAWMRQSIAASSPMVAALGMQRVVSDWDQGTDSICWQAPHLVIAHAPEGLPSGAHAAAIAMTYLDIAGQPLGVGMCWAGFVLVGAGVSPEVHASLGLPAGRRCAGVAMLGRPAVTYRRIPARNQPTIEWR